MILASNRNKASHNYRNFNTFQNFTRNFFYLENNKIKQFILKIWIHLSFETHLFILFNHL